MSFPSRTSFQGRRLSAPLALVALLALAACGKDGSGPVESRTPGIRVVSGGAAIDTIEAALDAALVVRVVRADGEPARGTVVVFEGTEVATGTLPPRAPSMRVAAGTGLPWETRTQVVADEDGVAAVRVRMGTVLGDAGIEVRVPDLLFVDTVSYLVRPGATARVAATPADTAVLVGAQYQVTALAVDRIGHLTGDAVQLRAATPTITELAGSTITARALGRGIVVATAGGVQDTVWTSVVPGATLAFVVPNIEGDPMLATARLDAQGFTLLPLAHEYTGAGLDWSPDGSFLVGGFTTTGRSLHRFTPAGASTVLVPSGTAVGQITDVDVSPDGQWVYFTAGSCNYSEVVYRVAAAGGTPQRVSAPQANECFDLVHAHVSVAPDGARAVVEHYDTPASAKELELLNLATGVATPLGVNGARPRWSPQGDRIAYVAEGRVWTVDPASGAVDVVSPEGASFAPGLAWSPDGAWLVVHHLEGNNVSTRLALLRVATRELLPLPTAIARGTSPAWRPAAP